MAYILLRLNMKTLIDGNYHSHTSRCGHAFGADEEYVLAANEAGFHVLGFSDHVMLPRANQPRMRGDISLLSDYVFSVNSLKRKYKGKVDIFLGFECEWYHGEYSDYYRDLLANRGFDYLILGQHCFRMDGKFFYYSSVLDEKRGLELYVRDVIAGINSGFFAYVAHPDHFLLWYGKWDEAAEKAALDICKAAKDKGVPLEINMGPSRWKTKTSLDDLSLVCYPYRKFFEIAKQVGNDVVIGVDAHAPSDYATSDYQWAYDFATRLGFQPLIRVKFPSIK